jgi:hypothetical protein
MRKSKFVTFQFTHILNTLGTGNALWDGHDIYNFIPQKDLVFVSAQYSLLGIPIDYNIEFSIGGNAALTTPPLIGTTLILGSGTIVSPNNFKFPLSKNSPNYYAPPDTVRLIAGRNYTLTSYGHFNMNPVCDSGTLTLIFIQHD